MSYNVAPGHEVSINGRRYLGGEALPEVAAIDFRALVESGAAVPSQPGKQPEPAKQERRR